MKSADIVSTSREYLGTPWIHTARLKGIGIDCIGLVICVYNEHGANIPPNNDYSLEDEFDKLTARLAQYFLEVNSSQRMPGDILVCRTRMMHNHTVIFSGEGTIIHAYQGEAYLNVCEVPFDAKWDLRVVKVFRHKDIEF